MRRSARERSPVEFAEGSNFDCHGCGLCCRAGWRIPVGPGACLPQDDQGVCLHLEAGRCSLHRDLGPQSKPSACRLFPFQVTDTPEGRLVGLSFFCPSVRLGRGRPAAAHAPELEPLLTRLPIEAVGTGPIEVGPGVTLGWTGYRLLEAELRGRLPCDPETCLQRLAGGLQAWDGSARLALSQLFEGEPVDLLGPYRDTPATLNALVLRYLDHLIWRKFLIRRGRLWDNLRTLARIPRALTRLGGDDEAVGRLENEHITHSYRPL